jgi:cell division protein FtsW
MTNRIEISTLPLSRNGSGLGILLAGLALLGLGTVMVYSACANLAAQAPWFERQEIRHVGFAVVSGLLMFTLWRVDYRWFYRSKVGYTLVIIALAASLAMCVMVMTKLGVKINGASRWLRIGKGMYSLTFQPSELVKLFSVVFLACWLGQPQRDTRRFFKVFVPAMGITLLCVGAVAKEDFSLAATIGITCVTVLFLAGVRWYYLLLLLPPAAGAVWLLVVKDPMRWARITAFLNPWNTAVANTYQARQALIAIGSGGVWGKGLGNGALKMGFLPEDSTDYIFAVICEELGFFGAAFVLGLVAVILFLSWRTAVRSGDRTGRLLAGGMGVLTVVQALLHVAVNAGSAPPTGTSLPLVSAGGTALLLGAVSLAAIVSVSAHQGGLQLEAGAALRDASPARQESAR